MIGWIVLGVAVLLLIIFWATYNSLVTARNRVENAWSQIDVQLKRRFDLIPNLIETVKGYAKHEKKVFEAVTLARTSMQNAVSLKDKAKANNMLSDTLKSLFAVAENYPTLKANENFLHLQEELAGTESKIAYSRQFYNDSVLSFNTKLQQFPTNMIANMFKFVAKEYFKVDSDVERKPVAVKFD